MAHARVRNARLREEGTRNLVSASMEAGVRRVVAQSIAFAYAPGPRPYIEGSPLNICDAEAGLTARAVESLERQVLEGPFEGIVLRYGKLYGPGTGFENPAKDGPVHVDAAANAARLAVTRGAEGTYNVAEEDGTVSSRKAVSDLGWDPDYRCQ
jgi:nucleoside-diphosphate-sugar epimerase